jgi:hypothetical protein
MMSTSRFFSIGLSLVLSGAFLVPAAMGDDEKASTRTLPKAHQTIKAGGITFEAPSPWKSLPPQSSMRKAVLTVTSPKNKDDVAELVVFAFPGGAGTVQQNIDRWESQFKTADGEATKAETKKVKGKNVDVTRVAVGGVYNDPFGKSGAKPAYRLLGGIVETPDAAYFIKFVGPKTVIDAAEKEFDVLLSTIQGPGK